MKIYISGISGTGMGPLALMAHEAGFEVIGSDRAKGAIYDELVEAGIRVQIGEQDGDFLKQNLADVDWFVYTSALGDNHPELVLAREAGVKCTKRDDFTAFLVEKLGLKMIAVAGTHGKTTTTSMIVWGLLKANVPIAYVVGTTLGFAPSGRYMKDAKYFVYEADEYDRNFLKYYPEISVITTVSYDHPDIYKTREEYEAAFRQFVEQSKMVYEMRGDEVVARGGGHESVGFFRPDHFKLAGAARRMDAALAAEVVKDVQLRDFAEDGKIVNYAPIWLIDAMNEFPGVGRRFERLSDGIYTDYAHHPEEIEATMEMAKEQAKLDGLKGVVAIYQPHQNTRQYEVKDGYKKAFVGASKIYWLPTYLTRENPDLKVILPEEFISDLENAEAAEAAAMDDELMAKILEWRGRGYLVLIMSAGPLDNFVRDRVV